MSEDAEIEPKSVAILTLAVRRSNHSARSHRIFSSPKWTTLTADTHIHHVHPNQHTQLLKFCPGLFSRLYSLSLIFRPCITSAFFILFFIIYRSDYSSYAFRPFFLIFSIINVFSCPVSEFIGPVFAKTSPKRSCSVIENYRFGLVFEKTGSINSDTVLSTVLYC